MEIITLQRTRKIVGAPCVFFSAAVPAVCLWSCWRQQSSPECRVSPWQAVLAWRGGQEVRKRGGWAGWRAVQGRRSGAWCPQCQHESSRLVIMDLSIRKDSAFSSANVEVTLATEVNECQRIQKRKHNGGHLPRVQSLSIPFPYHVFSTLRKTYRMSDDGEGL